MLVLKWLAICFILAMAIPCAVAWIITIAIDNGDFMVWLIGGFMLKIIACRMG
jgi:hypothetical protein